MEKRKRKSLENKSGGINMSNIIDVIKRLPNCIIGKKIDDKLIKITENELGLEFSKSYKDYLKEFGHISFGGTEITGITNNNYNDVVHLTQKLRKRDEDLDKNYYVVEDLASDGIYMLSDKTDKVFVYYNGEVKVKYKSFVDYINANINVSNE